MAMPANRVTDGLVFDWRARIAANLATPRAQRIRALFSEINPGLVGDKLFEDRWSDIRRDAAVLVPIIDRPSGPSVLLTVRSAEMPSHPGQISFPGGRIAPTDRDAVDAALREAEEEVGIAFGHVDVLGVLGVHQGGLGFSVTPVVGVVDPRAAVKADPREVAEIFEAPLAFFADLSNHGTEEREYRGVKYKMFCAPFGRYHIWGLTAGILRTLAEALQDEAIGAVR